MIGLSFERSDLGLFDLDIRHNGSSWPCIGQIRRSRSRVKVQGQTRKTFLFRKSECETGKTSDSAL